MRRAAAAKGRADSCQPEVIRAIELLGLPYKDLSSSGNGIEDLVVLLPPTRDVTGLVEVDPPQWLFVECKVKDRRSNGRAEVRYTEAQKEWRERTPEGPRITVTCFEDALLQLRERMGL